MAATDTALMAFMPEEAADLSGLTLPTVRRWRRIGLVGGESSYLGWRDLVGLRIVATLRKEHKVSLPRVLRVANYLSKFKARPLSELRIYVAGKRLYFLNPETGKIEDAEGSGQLHAEPPHAFGLEVVSSRLRREVHEKRQRTKAMRGAFTKKRGVQGGQPCFAGTRIRIATIKQWLDEGASQAEILKNYPRLTADDIRALRSGKLDRAS